MQYCFGVDVGGTTVKIGLFQENGTLMDQWEITTRKENQGTYILTDVATSLKEKMIEHAIETADLIGIGIGVPGPVDGNGVVLECVNLGWGTVNVAQVLNEAMGVPVYVANDANVAALGEAWQGGGKGYQDVVMITLGTGVGGGIILNGTILTGTNGAAGEIGHMLVNYDETDTCNCGKKGCLEQYASATGIVKQAKRMLEASEQPSMLREMETMTARDIFHSAKAGDVIAMEAVDQLCRSLGIALSHVAAVIDPQAFVIGGGVSKAGDVLATKISKHYNDCAMLALKDKVFRMAELGNDAGIYGSAKMALRK